MSAAASAQSSLMSELFRSEAQANLWRGPVISTSCTTLPTSLTPKPANPSVRNIRRKPVPKISTELLQQHPASSSCTSTSTSSTAPVPREVSLSNEPDTDAAPRKQVVPSIIEPENPTQRPQQQFILDIDDPISAEDQGTADNTVKELLLSASVSPSSVPARSRKMPLRWMQEKEEHTPFASTSTLPARQPTLSRKTSISAHLKLSLRRNKVENQSLELNISAPTNFVHLSTGTEGAHASSNTGSLRRASTTSKASTRSSMRSSLSSTLNTVSPCVNDFSSHVSLEQEAFDETPLHASTDRKHPLRPTKSIRRPFKPALEKAQPLLDNSAATTRLEDKRKAVYAPLGSAPTILKPTNVPSRSIAMPSKLSPIESPVSSQPSEHFAASLDRTLGHARGLGSGRVELSPEPELSRSPSSGYASSACNSNRSSLGSLQEFSTFLNFPEMPHGAKPNSDKASDPEDIWAGPTLSTPLSLSKF